MHRPTQMASPSPPLSSTVLICTPDARLGEGLAVAARTAAAEPLQVDAAAAFERTMRDVAPLLAVIDLASGDEWIPVLMRCRSNPQIDHVPIYALAASITVGSESAAGVDGIWSRVDACDLLICTVGHHMHPPVRYPDGWREPLSAAARQGVVEFNLGHYFEQHEYFEEAWNEERRPIRALYQGVLQIGLAFLQIERENWRGAVKMFRRGYPYLRDLPPICRGIHLFPFCAAAAAIHADLMVLGPQRLGELDRGRFPQLSVGEVDASIDGG